MKPENNVQSEPSAPVNNDTGSDVVFQDKPKKNLGMILGMVFLVILAAGGIGFGVWAMMDGNSQKEQLNTQITSLKGQVSELQGKIGNNTIDDCVLVDDQNAVTSDYIYVGEWGIKIRMPEELTMVSYLLDHRASENNEEYLYINGLAGNSDTVPSFINTPTQEYWLGCLHRLVQGEEPALRASMGTLVTTIDGFEYYYGHPQALKSSNEQDNELEMKSVDLIQQMLTNSENYSRF